MKIVITWRSGHLDLHENIADISFANNKIYLDFWQGKTPLVIDTRDIESFIITRYD